MRLNAGFDEVVQLTNTTGVRQSGSSQRLLPVAPQGSEPHYLAFDIETTGKKMRTVEVLQVGLIVYTVNFEEVDRLFLEVNPPSYYANGTVLLEPEALGVNKVDIVKHVKRALTPEKATNKIDYFLKKNRRSDKKHLVSVGHRMGFDTFILDNTIVPFIYNFVSANDFDTKTMARVCQDVLGVIPKTVKPNVEGLARFFGAPEEMLGQVHNAIVDAELTAFNAKNIIERMNALVTMAVT